MELRKKIEALLFYKSESTSVDELVKLCSANKDAILEALSMLTEDYKDRGITLMQEEDRYMLATAPSVSDFIKKIIQEEYSKDLGKAGLETLAVVLYRGPVTRAEIDHIRGVNSSFILRSLLIRGLVERLPNERDSRSFIYRPSFDLLRHLGVSRIQDLPEYTAVEKTLTTLTEENMETES